MFSVEERWRNFRGWIRAGILTEINIRPGLGYLRLSLFGGLQKEDFSPDLGKHNGLSTCVGALAGTLSPASAKHCGGHWVCSLCVFAGISLTVWDVLIKHASFARHPLHFLLNFTSHFYSWVRHFFRDNNLAIRDGWKKNRNYSAEVSEGLYWENISAYLYN